MELKDLKSFTVLKAKDPILASQVELVYNLTKETINGISGCYDNYTMHDMSHGLRVASYMENIAFGIDDDIDKRANAFNGLELALLILSAILHDIGMFITPQDKRDIKENKIKHNANSITFEGVLKVVSDEEEAVKEIVRLTHAARIEEFVEYKFERNKTISDVLQLDGKYPYSEDVVAICKAHGEDYSYISSMRKELTKGKYTYNLQYLAAILRIADLLDLDRQRTPILWYSLVEIKGYSAEEWEKHFNIQNEKKFKQHFDGKMQIYFDGKSTDAKIHRKYLRFIDQLKEELERADNLLNYKNAIEKYKLFVSTKVDDRVQTEGFKYADLRLNLDYSSITELLMGKNIYGDSRLGLRELVQNSIDACKLMEEVDRSEIDCPEIAITISFSQSKKYVKVKDTGIGMTLDVVKRHFLNVGRSYYKSNEYKYENHKYRPIGQYGIGFLACFLLSDTVNVKTKYYDSSEISHLELERSSEYVVTNTEETGSFWGTEITLDYDKFFGIFKNEEGVKAFLSEYFFTEVPIYLKNDDGGGRKEKIENNCDQATKNYLEKSSFKSSLKRKLEEITLDGDLETLSGKITIVSSDKIKGAESHTLPNRIYVFEKAGNKFGLADGTALRAGYYYIIHYAKLPQDEYERIRSTPRNVAQKRAEVLALAKKEANGMALLVGVDQNIDFHSMFISGREVMINGIGLKTILPESGLPYYKELLDKYDDYTLVFVSQNNYLQVYPCTFEKDIYPYEYRKDLEPAFFLYNKGIYVNGYDRMNCPYPCQAFGIGYMKYSGDELKLDVSRNKVIVGGGFLQDSVTRIILRKYLENEKNPQIAALVEKMIECIGQEGNME